MAIGNPIIVEKDVYELLTAKGYMTGFSSGYSLMPDSNNGDEDDFITVNAYGGISTMTNQFQRPNFQILIRSDDYDTGRTKAQNILDFLMNFPECLQYSFTINGHFYSLVFPMYTGVDALGRDEKNRELFSLNFNCFVEHSDVLLMGTTGDIIYVTTGDMLYGTSGDIIDEN